MKCICLGYIDKYFGGPTAKRSSHNSAKVGLDDRGREHRSLASLCRVVVPTHKRNRKETL